MCSVCGEPRIIPGFSGYRIYRCGAVESRWQKLRYWHSGLNLEDVWTPITDKVNKAGYPVVSLTRDGGGGKTLTKHRVLLETYVSARPTGYVARHLDGNPLNCSLTNLRWGTPSENEQDKKLHGTYCKNRGFAKLNWELVEEIRHVYSRGGISYVRLGKLYGVGKMAIGRIINEDSWKPSDKETCGTRRNSSNRIENKRSQ